MSLNKKGFSIVAALALAAVIATGAMFLGKILSYLTATRMRTQARISSLGYEDSMAVVVARGVVARNCDFSSAIPVSPIPGTSANLRFCDINGADSPITFAAYLNEDPEDPAPCDGEIPAEDPGSSERFIDGSALINFRVELISKAMTQDQKVFGAPLTCTAWQNLVPDPVTNVDQRQIKISYQIRRMFKGKPLSQSGSKILNLSELGL